MQNEPETLEEIIRSHPSPKQVKMESQLWRLNKMRDYYRTRLETADTPETVKLFKDIDSALSYSMTMIRLYDFVTRRLVAHSEGLPRPPRPERQEEA